MNSINLRMIGYYFAVLCNIPLLLIPLIALLFWQQGAYSNKDEVSATFVIIYITVIFILPSLAVSAFLLIQAYKGAKKSSSVFTIISAVYGVLASLYLGYWFLVQETTW